MLDIAHVIDGIAAMHSIPMSVTAVSLPNKALYISQMRFDSNECCRSFRTPARKLWFPMSQDFWGSITCTAGKGSHAPCKWMWETNSSIYGWTSQSSYNEVANLSALHKLEGFQIIKLHWSDHITPNSTPKVGRSVTYITARESSMWLCIDDSGHTFPAKTIKSHLYILSIIDTRMFNLFSSHTRYNTHHSTPSRKSFFTQQIW